MGYYDFQQIEKKWQEEWKKRNSFVAEKLSDKPKYYVLDMFPYPSGSGLHVGHPLGYIATDVVARFKRLKGFNVLHPMGFDAFGLPAEQYAIKTGIHPSITTEKNTARYLEQMEILGFHHDPETILRTSDPDYYKWTQWIFLKLFSHWYNLESQEAESIERLIQEFEQNGNQSVQAASDQKETFSAEEWKGMSEQEQHEVLMNYRLAYESYATVNWCAELGTVLANEEVKDGRSERGGFPVERKEMRQWMLRITAYADRLLEGLDTIDWPESIKIQQTNWIGRSEGATIRYEIDADTDEPIEVFTTRPDTLYGNTFMVLAPEHPLVAQITTAAQKSDIDTYVEWAASRTERDRIAETKKTGVFTGAYAVHPMSGKKLPIWISDYVLITYGTGAIMCVPGHDSRDYEFAKKFGIEIIEVISGGNLDEEAYLSKDGIMVNSDFLNGLKASEAITKMTERLEEMGIGKAHITYRLRDVIWSRQRYWGEPTPIVHKNGIAMAVADDELPVVLPPVESYKPTGDGEPPLARATEWLSLEDGSTREVNTMPGLAGSSWYFFRYYDAKNNTEFADKDKTNYWMPVDLYMGGAEHAVGHLLYSRFWTKFLKDMGEVSVEEPFQKLINQGMIQGISEKMFRCKLKTNEVFYKNEAGEWQSVQIEGDSREIFVSYEMADGYPGMDDLDEVTPMFVHIDFVKDYQSQESNSYLDGEAMKQAFTLHKDYEEGVFVCEGGYYIQGEYTAFDQEGSDKFYTKAEVEKMSKSRYNTVNPDDMAEKYGADCFRLYEMFLGPIEHHKPWDVQGIEGVSRFLKKAYGLFVGDDDELLVTDDKPNADELRILHKAIHKIEEDIERLSFNTCVPVYMTFIRDIGKLKCHKRAILEPFLIMLSPFAPHVAEELWEKLGHTESILKTTYPVFEEKYVVENSVNYPIQINGKVRVKLSIPADFSKQQVEEMVLADEKVQDWMKGKSPRKVIVVPGRIVNVVV